MTIDDVQGLAWNVMALPTPKKVTPNPDSAIYKFWRDHKDLGAPFFYGGKPEIALDDGTTALILTTSKVLWWRGGDEVVVV